MMFSFYVFSVKIQERKYCVKSQRHTQDEHYHDFDTITRLRTGYKRFMAYPIASLAWVCSLSEVLSISLPFQTFRSKSIIRFGQFSQLKFPSRINLLTALTRSLTGGFAFGADIVKP